jgi:rhodanese-related sulfurtransferase
VQRISRDDSRTLLNDGDLILVEALPELQYYAEHLPGAVNVPGELTADVAAQLAPVRDRTVVPYCCGEFRGRSKAAAAAFVGLGYTDVRVFTGGRARWAEADRPFEGTRTASKAA